MEGTIEELPESSELCQYFQDHIVKIDLDIERELVTRADDQPNAGNDDEEILSPIEQVNKYLKGLFSYFRYFPL
jgi:hypothetical protein